LRAGAAGPGQLEVQLVEESLPCREQWDRKSAMVNQLLMFLPTPIGAYALLKHKPRKLLPYLAGATAFVTVWRRFVCARCQYYGRECSTMMGITTAMMMPRDESRQLDRSAMVADFAIIGALVLFPLPQVFKEFHLTVVYLAAAAAGLGSILINACPRCGNDFCPMKDLHRAITSSWGGVAAGHSH